MKNVPSKTPSLALLITLVGFPQISESIFTPILPALSRAYHVSAGTSQLTMSSYFIAFAIGVLAWGQLADRWGRRPAMLGGLTLYLLGNVGLWFSPNFSTLLAWRLVQALGASAGSVVTQTIMRESFAGLAGAKVFARVSAAMALAPALGPLIGGATQTWLGYHHVFSVLITLAISVLLYAGARLPETRPSSALTTTTSTRVLLKRLIHDPVVLCYGGLIGGINGILFSYYAEAPFIFENHFGYSGVQYGALGLVVAAASLLGALLVNGLLNHFQPERVALYGLLLSLLAAAGLLLAAMLDQAGAMVGCIFLTFLGLNITLPNALNRALIGYEAVMGRASGWFSLGYYLLVSALTGLMSVLHSGSILRLPLYIGGLCLLMGLSYWRLIRHHPTAVSDQITD